MHPPPILDSREKHSQEPRKTSVLNNNRVEARSTVVQRCLGGIKTCTIDSAQCINPDKTDCKTQHTRPHLKLCKHLPAVSAYPS